MRLAAIARAPGITVSDILGDRVKELKVDAYYVRANVAQQILSEPQASEALRVLAGDQKPTKAPSITGEEWQCLALIQLPTPIPKDGYVQLLSTIRAISGSPGATLR